MNEIIAWVFTALPWVLAASIPAAAMAALLVGRRSAVWWVGAYFLLLFYFPNASWGLVERGAGTNFYTRGTGTFYFSAINVMLFGLAIQAFFARRFAAPLIARHNLGVPAWLFGLLLAGNLVLGLALDHVRWFQLIAYGGLLNVFNFMLVFYVLMAVLREPRDLDRFMNLLLFCVVTRGLWGLFRFAALGGDPANFYANFQKIEVRLTFFDINDSLLAMMALLLVLWRLVHQPGLPWRMRAGYWGVVLLELFIIVFSQRRSAWGGLVLVGGLLVLVLRGRWRWGLLASSVLVGLPVLAYKMVKRAGHTGHGSLLERMLPDVVQNGQFSFTTGRFAELYAAWLSLKHQPLFGLGAWGRYDGFRFSDLAWHQGDFSWMHSGLLHIVLKTGLVGLAIMLALFWLHCRFLRRVGPTLPTAERGVLLVGAAGTLFMLPTWLIGTPVIEYRTMQLLALCLALPYLAAAAAPASAAQAVPESRWPWMRRPPAAAGLAAGRA